MIEVPESVIQEVPEPARSAVSILWRTAQRFERRGDRTRANSCYRRIVEIKNPIRIACGTRPLPIDR